MDIITRNFFRLLRAGSFGEQEPIEPLSAWKWQRLYQLALMHNVEQLVLKGILCCHSQFFVQLPAPLMEEWQKQHYDNEDEEENTMLTADRLTNPLLNHRLQAILDEEDTTTETRKMLLMLLGVARFIMNAGIPIKLVAELAVFLRQSGNTVDYERLQTWIDRLSMQQMAQLTGILLVRIMHLEAEEIPFMRPESETSMDRRVHEIFKLKNSHAEEWYFSQGKNIFVHTANPSAMLWHVRRSARFFRYFPAETMTNFFASFAHSLSHIEE